LADLTANLRHWYFAVGGIYLSGDARDAYFAVRREIARLLDASSEGAKELAPGDSKSLRDIGSQLRTAMTMDVDTRRKPLLGHGASA
jgi:hypothetical protein